MLAGLRNWVYVHANRRLKEEPVTATRDPFGQADCESELRVLKGDYSRLYFGETPFNEAAIQPETYLIIGRRGSGKTALAQYFSFQKVIKNPVYIDVDEPAVYQQVLSDIAERASESREIGIPRLKKMWEYIIWCVIFRHTQDLSPVIDQACHAECRTGGRVSRFVNDIIERLLSAFGEVEPKRLEVEIEELMAEEHIISAKSEVVSVAVDHPVIIAIDTLEKYEIANEPLMNAMAALIQFAADFNLEYSARGLHLKVFMSGEVFPFLKEEVLQNPLKSVKNPVYLLWRPKDLLRLIGWRFYQHLEASNLLLKDSRGSIDWEDHHQVLRKMWNPYFGTDIQNARGLRERTFSYVLRHTQMRPRQLILLCNAVANLARRNGRFPVFAESDIRSAIKEAERDLAIEIINSFSSVYPHVSTILDALMKMPMKFSGNELDKRARQSASEWPPGTYSPARFRRLVAELGIVGRIRRENTDAGYIDADFEYAIPDRLPVTHRDDCVIHPMFYAKFAVVFDPQSAARVMPFSTEREAREADGEP